SRRRGGCRGFPRRRSPRSLSLADPLRSLSPADDGSPHSFSPAFPPTASCRRYLIPSLPNAVIPQVRVKRPRRPLSCGNSRVAFVNYNDKEVLCNNYLFHNDLRTKFTPNVLGVKLEML
ncbi:unnamed protein product, partial [Urochloa humidicola]